MYSDVGDYMTKCKVCQKNKFTIPYSKAPFQETDTQFHPWDKIYLDIAGPMPVAKGHKYILTCQRNLSKYLVAVPMFSQFKCHALCHITIWRTLLHSDRSGITIYGRFVQKIM
jgi:hypothetical protein